MYCVKRNNAISLLWSVGFLFFIKKIRYFLEKCSYGLAISKTIKQLFAVLFCLCREN